jgi:hypothetical protein
MTLPVGLEETEFDILLDQYDSGTSAAARKLLEFQANLDDAVFRTHVLLTADKTLPERAA